MYFVDNTVFNTFILGSYPICFYIKIALPNHVLECVTQYMNVKDKYVILVDSLVWFIFQEYF